MYQRLIKLADYFDSVGRNRSANYIDGLIKLSQSQSTFQDFSTDVLEPEFIDGETEYQFGTDKLRAGFYSHPLVSAIKDVIIKLFEIDDPSRNSEPLTKKELNNIYNQVLKYDSDLNYYQGSDFNFNVITPVEFQNLVDSIYRAVKDVYTGEVRQQELRVSQRGTGSLMPGGPPVRQDIVEFLIIPFNELYLDYMGEEKEIEPLDT